MCCWLQKCQKEKLASDQARGATGREIAFPCWHIFVSILNCICLNLEMYLSKSWNVYTSQVPRWKTHLGTGKGCNKALRISILTWNTFHSFFSLDTINTPFCHTINSLFWGRFFWQGMTSILWWGGETRRRRLLIFTGRRRRWWRKNCAESICSS